MEGRYMSGKTRLLTVALAAAVALSLACSVSASEIRAFWIDAWGTGFLNQTQVDTLLGVVGNGTSIGEIRDANCNTVVVQVRRRADVCYPSGMSEPYMSGLSPSNFNALQAIINAAHDTTGGKARLNVIAWFVIFPTGTGTIYDAHNDSGDSANYWMTRSNTGAEDDGSGDGYQFDPGHPNAENYLVNVVMDVVNNYDVDGIQLDRIRFTGDTWGYNPTSVSRYNAHYGLSGSPTYTDDNWEQWRRDQITNFMRKVYVKCMDVKPNLEVSAAVVTWAPGPSTSTRSAFQATRPYYQVFQDWDAWTQEGILDTCYTMNYFNQSGAYASEYVDWMNFQKDRKFNRRTVVGPGIYINSLSDAILQLDMTRDASGNGYYAEGFSGYSYRLPYLSGVWSTFKASLKANITPTWDSAPTMSWKSSPTNSHVMGTITDAGTAIDTVTVSISGSESRSISTDGTGFYGFVDLTPGDYTVSCTYGGTTKNATATVVAGEVDTVDITFNADTKIVDDLDAGVTWTGTWSTGTIAGGWPTTASEYKYTTTVTTADHTCIWRPTLTTAGNYDVYVWYLAGSNRTTAAPFTVYYSGGSQSVNVNQTVNGSQWYKIASSKAFSSGTTGYVKLANNASVTGKVVIADAVKFVMLTPTGPTITTQPSPQNICAGSTASFTVAATGSGTLTYQWQKNSVNLSNGGDISGATSTTLSIANCDAADAANYRCVVTDANGSTNSNEAALTLKTATSITTHPSNATVNIGATATFTVVAAGSGTLTYQWQKNSVNLSNGGDISGATSTTLSIANCDATDAANYRCVVTGDCGSATSNTATLTVNALSTVILDENQGTYSGAWSLSTGAGTAAYNGDYKYTSSALTETAWYKWTPTLGTANYAVYVMFRSGTNRPTNARYTIYYNGGSQTYTVNQTINGGTWVLLGTKPFVSGTTGYVKLSNDTDSTGKAVIADAVKWVPQ